MTDPRHPPVPPVSTRDAPNFSDHRHRTAGGGAFIRHSDVYHDVRPGYPPQILELARPFHRILDVGAGTGKLTAALAKAGHRVHALDPSMDMLRVLRTNHPEIACWQATAEATAAATACVDLITCAQTWHWVDVDRAAGEFDRVLRPDGAVLLAWNNLDTSVAWVHRLSRIMHAGDVLRPGFTPELAAPWRIDTEVRTTWRQLLTPGQLIELAHTRSYWLRSTAKIRERVDTNLNWYLFEHLGFTADSEIALPYRSDGFLLRRAG